MSGTGNEITGALDRAQQEASLIAMADLPETRSVPVVRADFANDALWTQLKGEIAIPTDDGFLANVEFVEDRSLAGLDEAMIVEAVPRAYPHQYEHPVMFSLTASPCRHRTIRSSSST